MSSSNVENNNAEHQTIRYIHSHNTIFSLSKFQIEFCLYTILQNGLPGRVQVRQLLSVATAFYGACGDRPRLATAPPKTSAPHKIPFQYNPEEQIPIDSQHHLPYHTKRSTTPRVSSVLTYRKECKTEGRPEQRIIVQM